MIPQTTKEPKIHNVSLMLNIVKKMKPTNLMHQLAHSALPLPGSPCVTENISKHDIP